MEPSSHPRLRSPTLLTYFHKSAWVCVCVDQHTAWNIYIHIYIYTCVCLMYDLPALLMILAMKLWVMIFHSYIFYILYIYLYNWKYIDILLCIFVYWALQIFYELEALLVLYLSHYIYIYHIENISNIKKKI